jgi:hypothetical protein
MPTSTFVIIKALNESKRRERNDDDMNKLKEQEGNKCGKRGGNRDKGKEERDEE